MTREDAIYEIRQLAVLSTNKNIEHITEALNMAIEALQDEIWKDEPCDGCPTCKYGRHGNITDEERCEQCSFGTVNNYEPIEPQTIAEDINRRVEMVKKEWNARHIDEFFREPTAEERKAVADYIDSISVPTGVNVFDFMDEPTSSKMEQVEDEPQTERSE